MANICVSRIAVVGLKEPPEDFVKKLSKVMFDIDLDNMDVTKWGLYRCEGGKLYDADGEEIDGKTWYQKIVHDEYPPLCILVPDKPFITAGAAVQRFKVETKWKPPYDELKKASEIFSELTFSLSYFIEQDGPTGEIIIRGGKEIDFDQTAQSWYLFDEIQYPCLPLLPRYMDLTLAQRGQAAIETARDFVKRVHRVLHDGSFTESRYAPFRDEEKLAVATRVIDSLLAGCEEAAKLTFKGVFLPDMTVEETDTRTDVEIAEAVGWRIEDGSKDCLGI
jgi:hypothetical protein